MITYNVSILYHSACTSNPDRLLSYPDNSDRLARIVDIEVVDGTGEGDREKVRALPEAADLLVLNLTSHLELTAAIKYAHAYM